MSFVGWLVENVLQHAFLPLIYANVLPDFMIRFGIRKLCRNITLEHRPASYEDLVKRKMAYVEDLKKRPLAMSTQEANEQHYEVPASFYEFVMGKNKKYSCGLWPKGVKTLDDSEDVALALVCERAEISATQPMRILDMGCGWGSFSLYCAAKFPNVQVTGVSNSNTQREYIMNQAKIRGLNNVKIVTCDINNFAGDEGNFDRIVSIEMMEHVKNYDLLLERASSWLKKDGKMFVHIFTNKDTPFHYEKGFMAENFFTNGQMPSDDLLFYFQRNLTIEKHWFINGQQYAKTCNAWLEKMDRNKKSVVQVLEDTYGKGQGFTKYINWRLFFLGCAELFDYDGGNEWGVSHYLFNNNKKA